MTNQKQPFGIDVSKWQGRIDFAKLVKANPKVTFVAMRLGISYGYVDEQYYNNMKGAKAYGLNRIIYHVPYFHVDAKMQTDSVMETLKKTDFDPRYDRIAIDAEQNNGQTKSGVTQKTAEILELLKKQINRYPMIYSRGNWVDQWLFVNQLPNVDWWLATYLTANPSGFTPEHPGPPILPKGVNTWLIHQTGERNDGRKYGMESVYLDSNRWNGTSEEMNAYFGRGEIIPEPEPEPPVIPVKQTATVYAWATPYVFVRDKASMTGAVVGRNYPLDTVDVKGKSGDWLQFANGYSMAMYYEVKTETMKPLPEPEPTIPDGLLDVPHYSQTDPLWAQDIIGASNFNIGAKGCLLTITAAGLSYLGYSVDPKQYNKLATNKGGYLITVEGGKRYANMYWKFPDILTGQQIVRDEYQTFASGKGWEKSANAILAKGKPVWCEVRLNNYQHWVMILGKVDGDYWILDPIDGAVKELDYPLVYRTVSYSKRGA